MHDSKTFREAKLRQRTDKEEYIRFSPFERFLHLLVISSFLLLVLTGMPLKFYYTDWAKTLFDVMGGPEVAGALHRFGAIVTLLYFTLHIGGVVASVWARRPQFRDPETKRFSLRRFAGFAFGPDSPMPTWQDVKDFIAHQKWFFGKGPKPQFDRWTYWEKFDYLAVFWGVFMIGMSGLIMWFPEFFTRFMPGWMINVALVIHSDEALLAAGFIFTFHFFNVHFRIEKFPMDPVIFSGRVSREELEHDRGRWLARLQESGELEKLKVGDEWQQTKKLAIPIGVLAFTIGVALIILIYVAMSARLLN
jgi:cytochrome b subunit of formate dehydrogenase